MKKTILLIFLMMPAIRTQETEVLWMEVLYYIIIQEEVLVIHSRVHQDTVEMAKAIGSIS